MGELPPHRRRRGAGGSWILLPKGTGGVLGVGAAATVSLGASGAVFGLFAVSVLTKFRMDLRKLLEAVILGQFVLKGSSERRRRRRRARGEEGGAGGVNPFAHLAGARSRASRSSPRSPNSSPPEGDDATSSKKTREAGGRARVDG